MTDLSNKLRPNSLESFIGQSHILSKDKSLYKLIKKKEIPHLFFYGKPGTGKTTLAKIIAKEIFSDYYYFNATSVKIEDLRKIFDKYKGTLVKPLIFIDEVHRLSKVQQEVLLPFMENYNVIIIGASTENPFFSLTSAIRSRSFIYEFKPFTYEEMKIIAMNALEGIDVSLNDNAFDYLIISSCGDARAMLTLLDFSLKISNIINIDILKELRESVISEGSSSSSTHYDLTSAMIKSIRGSNIDASIYYLARLLNSGEDINFIARRLVVLASEDIGNANPNALNLAVSAMQACQSIGMPESRIILSQCIVYLASSPKSNSSYNAINKALEDIKNGEILDIPKNIDSQQIGYLYPHDFGGYIKQKYLSKNIKYYTSKEIGFEKNLVEWLNKITNKD